MAKAKAPARRSSSAAGSRDVISTTGYLVIFILMAIPVVGLILCIVWAFGEGNLNRRNLCRAGLILMAVGIVLSIISFGVVHSVIRPLLGSIMGGL